VLGFRYLWKRTNFLTGENEVTIEWDVGKTVEPGEYRIRHNGHYKTESGAINPYEGVTQSFTVA
jgi:neutral ceramidase